MVFTYPVPIDRFEFVSRIGSRSSYGEVWTVRTKTFVPTSINTPSVGFGPNTAFASKVLRIRPGVITREEIEEELRAISKVATANHPNIVTVYGTTFQPDPRTDSYYILMELMDTSLDALLDELHKKYDFWDYWFHATVPYRYGFDPCDIVRGLEFIHGLDEIHRDLKPANVLVRRKGDLIALKISDFGFTTTGQSSKMYESRRGRVTEQYGAPELFLHDQYSKKSDIWSFGCILFEAVSACLDRGTPFSSIYAVTSYYSNTSIPPPQISWQTVGSTPRLIPMSARPMRDRVEQHWQNLNVIFEAVFHRDPKKRPKPRILIKYIQDCQENRPIQRQQT